MRKMSLFVLVFALICSCQVQKPVITKKEPMPDNISHSPAQAPDKLVLSEEKSHTPLFGKILKEVSVSKSFFNPSLNQTITLSYLLEKPAKVTVSVYDSDSGLVMQKTGEKYLTPGTQTWIWDGKDMDGAVVPDEAYFFTVIAEDSGGEKDIYDPTIFSGGVEHDITEATLNPNDHSINYNMPEMGRVMIRMGIQGGPLMNQLIDWKPRIKGAVTEYWNGKDRDNLVDIFNHPKFKMIVTYFTFPDNSVIVFGNKSTDYARYKHLTGPRRPLKPERASHVSGRSAHFRLKRAVDYTPDISVKLDNVQGTDPAGLPVISKKAMVTVELNEKDKVIFQKSQFEICFFLDYRFYAEDETGFTPFNWVWDLSGVEEGEHVLTVNISSFQDQIGLITKKVRVKK